MTRKLIISVPACNDTGILADEAERIAGLIREGFFSGEDRGGTWWRIETNQGDGK